MSETTWINLHFDVADEFLGEFTRDEFIKKVNELFEHYVPEEYAASASLVLRQWGDVYDGYSKFEADIHFRRPEEEYERRARLQYAERHVTELEADRAEYDRLRKKFEGK